MSPGGAQGRRLLTVALGAAAAVLAAAALAVAPRTPSLTTIAVIAIAVTLADLVGVDLPHRRGGIARFTLVDAALTGGLLLVPPAELLPGLTFGLVVSQFIERVPPFKTIFNTAQYLAGVSLAALIVQSTAPRPGPLGPRVFLVVAVGVGLFMLVNLISVGGVIAVTSSRPPRDVLRRLLPTGLLIALCNAGLGLLAVLLTDTYPWALPALGIPLLLLWRASRQEVRAQLDRERAAASVAVEHTLGQARTPERVCSMLAEGVERIVGCQGAVWQDGRWVTPVPLGSDDCPLDGSLSLPLRTQGPALGPAVDTECLALGLGSGVLVVWPGELGLTVEAEEWLTRLATSGRVHLARAAGSVALHREQETLRNVVDGTGDGILVLDAEGRVQLWNPAMARLSRVPSEAAIGQPVAELLGHGPWEDEGVADLTRDDDRVWRVSVTLIEHDEQGTLRAAVVHDVSAERRVARMKDDMLAVVSHELRTPLTPIKASAQLLRLRWERLSDDRRAELLGHIESRADHLARLVEDLLLAGQISAQGRRAPVVSVQPVDLGALLTEEVAQLTLARPDHTLTVHGTPGPLEIATDPLRLRQIIDNLLDNACKFSPAGSRVEVLLTVENDEAVVRVVDQGRGIAPEDLERVFERFERVEDPLVMTTSGAGLGLSIVKALVIALGGSVQLHSVLGEGTTAIVRLPLPLPATAYEPVAAVR